MFPELLIFGGLSAAFAAVGRKVTEHRRLQEKTRQQVALEQIKAMQVAHQMSATAWQARQQMHQIVMDELRRSP